MYSKLTLRELIETANLGINIKHYSGIVCNSTPKNRIGLTFIFGFNLVQLKGIYPNFVISGAFSIAPGPLKILKDCLKDLGRKKVNL